MWVPCENYVESISHCLCGNLRCISHCKLWIGFFFQCRFKIPPPKKRKKLHVFSLMCNLWCLQITSFIFSSVVYFFNHCGMRTLLVVPGLGWVLCGTLDRSTRVRLHPKVTDSLHLSYSAAVGLQHGTPFKSHPHLSALSGVALATFYGSTLCLYGSP